MCRPVRGTALAALTVMLDSAVNIAFPAISAAFRVPATSIQWVALAYVGAFAVGLLPAGRLADRAGPGWALRAGLAITAGAQLACGLAPAWPGLLAARVVQGVGAALVMAAAPAAVTRGVAADRRARALGRLGLAASLGVVLGPLLGGALLAPLGWRVVYLGRVPLALGALWLARGAARPPAGPRPAVAESLAPAPEAGPGTLGAAPAGGAAGRADRWGFVAANAAHLLAAAALFAVWLLVPYYLLERRGYPAPVGGLLFTAGPLAWAVATPLGGRAAGRGLGGLASAALVAEAAGLWLTGRLSDAASPAMIVAALGLAGLGYGLFAVPNMHDVLGALPRGRQGVGGSVVALMRTAGILVGANATTAVYAARLASHLRAGGSPLDARAAAFAEAFTAAAAVAALAALLALRRPGR